MKQKLAFIVLLLLLLNSTNILAESIKNGPDGLDAASVLAEVEEKINKGEDIYYDNITIKGDLDFSLLNLSSSREDSSLRVFPRKIEIINSKIDGIVTGNAICFLDQVNFENTVFIKGVNFEASYFQDLIELSGTSFRDAANFAQSHFEGVFNCRDASFLSVLFDASAFSGPSAIFAKSSFDEARFKGVHFIGSEADYSDCVFKGLADFSSSEFQGEPNFIDSKFLGDMLFTRANFTEAVDFGNLIFEGPIDYSYARFNGDVSFKDAKFNNYASFGSASFNGEAEFDNARFSSEAYFKNAVFNGDAKFNNSRFSNEAFFDGATFNKTVFLTQAHYQKFYARWKSLEKGMDYNDETYLSLIKNYKDLGWFEDANDCYYMYRCEYRQQNYDLSPPALSELNVGLGHYLSLWPSWIKDLLLWTADSIFMSLNGYGVNPFWPLKWMLVAIPLFGIFYWWVDDTPFWSALKFSVVVFLSGSGKLFVQAPDYTPNPKNSHRLASFSTIVFYLERIMGMIIFVAFLIAFGTTVLR